MNDAKNLQPELDPHLRRMLAAYGSIPERQPQSANRTRVGFMAELDSMFVESTSPRVTTQVSDISTWPLSLIGLKEFLLHSFANRSIRLVMATLMIVSMFLFSGVGITATAASSALPGDPLYSVKTTAESVRANLTLDSGEQAHLYLDFARLRLIEMQSLIVRHRYDDIPLAANEYERDVQKALRAVEHLSRADRMEGIALNTELASILRMYRAALAQMMILVPDDKRPVLQRAIAVSQPVTGSRDDHDGTAGPLLMPTLTATSTPTGTISPTPAGSLPESTQGSSTPTPLSSSNNNSGPDDRNDDSTRDDSSVDDRGGNDDDDGDDNGDDNGDDDGGDG